MLLVGGPTAAGKTEFALRLAERYGAEIVGADSRQVYAGMPIGTAAPTGAQRARVPHHLVGFVDPHERYSAARYVVDAAAAIDAIRRRGKRAIVVGGTGFYLRALAGDVDLAAQPDPAVRERVAAERRAHPVEVLHAWLRARNAVRADAIATRDPYRIGRALEVELARALPAVERTLPSLRAAGIPYRKLVLDVEVEELTRRIAARTDAMLAAGLLDEAQRIGAAAIAADAVGYREALAYLDGRLTAGELRALLSRNTRRYAKRQLTWFRGEADAQWSEPGDLAIADALASALGWSVAPEREGVQRA